MTTSTNCGPFAYKDRPSLLLELTSSATQVRKALETVQEYVREAFPEEGIEDTTQIVVAEVLNNVVEHAYEGKQGFPITLTIVSHPKG